MALARTFAMLLGALGVLLLGGLAPAMAENRAPPCHAMVGKTDHAPASRHDLAMKAMACCIACIAAPSITPPLRAPVVVVRTTPTARPRVLPTGRRPSPDTGPPKG